MKENIGFVEKSKRKIHKKSEMHKEQLDKYRKELAEMLISK